MLVDALVAMALLTLTLAFAAQAVGDGARRTAAAERSRLAALEAQSRLDEVGGDIPLQVGRDEGQDAGLTWRVDISPAAGLASAQGRLLDVAVQVYAPGGGLLATLRSRRMGGA